MASIGKSTNTKRRLDIAAVIRQAPPPEFVIPELYSATSFVFAWNPNNNHWLVVKAMWKTVGQGTIRIYDSGRRHRIAVRYPTELKQFLELVALTHPASLFAKVHWKSATLIYKDTVQQLADDCGVFAAWNLRMILNKKRPAKSASDAIGLGVAFRHEFLAEAHSTITSRDPAYRCKQEILQVHIEGSAGVKGDAAGNKGKPSGVKSNATGVQDKTAGNRSKPSGIKSNGTGVEGKGAGNMRKPAGDIPNSTVGSIPADDPPNINSLIKVMGEDTMYEGEDLNYDTDSSDGVAEEAFSAQKTQDSAWYDHHDELLKVNSGIITKAMASVKILGNRKHGMPGPRFWRRLKRRASARGFKRWSHLSSSPTSLLASVKPDGQILYGEYTKRSERVLPLYPEVSSITSGNPPSAIAAHAKAVHT